MPMSYLQNHTKEFEVLQGRRGKGSRKDLLEAKRPTAAVAVVGGREDGDDILVMAGVVALHDELVGSGHQVQGIRVVELLADVLPEGVAGSAW